MDLNSNINIRIFPAGLFLTLSFLIICKLKICITIKPTPLEKYLFKKKERDMRESVNVRMMKEGKEKE